MFLFKMVKALGLLLVVGSNISCTKTIPVSLDPYEPKVAIESLLQPGVTPKVYVNSSVAYFGPNQLPSNLFIENANVVISGAGKVDILQADSVYNRFFCRFEPFYSGSEIIEKDVEYTLSVVVGEDSYSATTVTDLTAVSIDNVNYTSNFTDLYGGHEGVIVDFSDIPGEANQYRFRMDRPLNNEHETVDDFEISSTCMAEGETYVVEEYGRFVYFDTAFDGAPVRFVAEPAYTNRKGDSSLVYVESMDLASAQYYDALDSQREANINPFIEPVFLDSKIDGAIGVFGSVVLSAPVQFVFPEDSQ